MTNQTYPLQQGLEIIHVDRAEIVQNHESQMDNQVLIGDQTLVLWDINNNANPLATRKSFKKEKRLLMNEINQVFKNHDDVVHFIQHGAYEVKTCPTIERQISIIIPARHKPLLFQPFAFCKNNQRIGGVYFNISRTPSTGTNKDVLPNAAKKILTGMCLRPNLLAIDENDEKIDIVLQGSKLKNRIRSFQIIDGTHVYEATHLEMQHNLFPFFTTILSCDRPQVCFHLPLPEYLLYGVSMFLNGKMTSDVLDMYADLFVKHALQLKQKLSQKFGDCRLEISSPLDALTEGSLNSNKSFTQQFFEKLSINLEKLTRDDSVEHVVSITVINWLKNQRGFAGEAWKILAVSDQSTDEKEVNINLRAIACWSNCVFYMLHSTGMRNGEVFVVDDKEEIRIIQVLKKHIQSSSLPSLQCFYWLAPVQIFSDKTLFRVPIAKDGMNVDDIEKIFQRASLATSSHALH